MLLPERRAEIMHILNEKQVVSVTELSKRLYISETSVRRDLGQLEKSGMVKRVYGGAMLVSGENEVLSLDVRIETGKEGKHIIARKAVECIRDNSVIFLDSSSTALAMLPMLERFNSLTVITNGARTAQQLGESSKVRVYCTGGLLTPGLYSYSGALTCRALECFYADAAFISPKSMEIGLGAFCSSEEEVSVRRMMLQRSNRKIMLCHTDKLANHAPFQLCDYSEINTIILDKRPDDAWCELFERHGIQFL